ncbi:MAG: hypothetical protein MK089_08705 [Phycisphaerales bacterium]|nr:hypothetical protein [Phycisphaerales bacterium]
MEAVDGRYIIAFADGHISIVGRNRFEELKERSLRQEDPEQMNDGAEEEPQGEASANDHDAVHHDQPDPDHF